MNPFRSNIDIVPLEQFGSIMDTSIDVVANHCDIMSENPYGAISEKGLLPSSPERGPKRGEPAPYGAKQVRN